MRSIFGMTCYFSFNTSYFSIIISFLIAPFLTTLLNLAKSSGTAFNLPVSILSTSVFKAA